MRKEERAQKDRKHNIEAMDIFDVRSDQAPSRATMQLGLMEEESTGSMLPGSTDWISRGIKIRDSQYVIPLYQIS